MMEAKAGAGQHRYACSLGLFTRVRRRTIKQAWRRVLTCVRGRGWIALAVGDGAVGSRGESRAEDETRWRGRRCWCGLERWWLWMDVEDERVGQWRGRVHAWEGCAVHAGVGWLAAGLAGPLGWVSQGRACSAWRPSYGG